MHGLAALECTSGVRLARLAERRTYGAVMKPDLADTRRLPPELI